MFSAIHLQPRITAITESEEMTEQETFDDPDIADIPLYPGLPEHASIGEIPEEDEHLEAVCDIAA